MSLQIADEFQRDGNPIDLVEEMVLANEWAGDRASEDEMIVEVRGRFCDYRMFFIWRPDIAALHFSCILEGRVPPPRRQEMHNLLAMVNEQLWLGHFDLCSEENVPMFRQTLPMRGVGQASTEQIEDVMEIALNECERFFPAFQFVVWGGKAAMEAMSAAMFETVGEA